MALKVRSSIENHMAAASTTLEEDMQMQRVLPELYEGHAPITLQNAFHDALEALEEWKEGSEEPRVTVDGVVVPISHVLVGMSACTDLLPLRTRGVLEEIIDRDTIRAAGGLIYADAARLAMASCMKGLDHASRQVPAATMVQAHQACVEL
ncbi:hypothetical protein [Mesorhizobium sp. WSM2239]|uniref:Uncharacterized protein n=2 Tax=unclassified Mesorhizobium TaxID=325217 RepID=A0AAU8D7D7_9HYPH